MATRLISHDRAPALTAGQVIFGGLLACLYFTGCAGPATPLGAPWATDTSQVRNGPLAFIAGLFEKSSAKIRFEPEHQVVHGPSPLKIIVSDPAGVKSNFHLVVRYNAIDITPSFLRQADFERKADELVITVPTVRLSPASDHLIEVVYGRTGQGKDSLSAYAKLPPARCHAFAEHQGSLQSVPGFNPPSGMVSAIDRISRQFNMNPTFTAALVAQESSFNPQTVSWAKAIGLTQITPVAEDEVFEQFTGWPRYPGINEMSAFWVKTLVSSGRMNASNEWRLDTERSLQGGLAYIKMLGERWSAPDKTARLKELFDDPEAARLRLLLASYNSGYTRVLSALNRYGSNWLTAPELREARRYVNRIFSYCDSFHNEVIYEKQT